MSEIGRSHDVLALMLVAACGSLSICNALYLFPSRQKPCAAPDVVLVQRPPMQPVPPTRMSFDQ
ncbi:hypothetical protein BDZ90DRAFT_229480 [Jaminaea rosea]|uniref:Uncharacterized protein n=1 Tax=Jaminaea rosea TaxID=1569628 RepID=A0A316UYR8_9BASI|nr:hypothetical protein BDZ90DRAFT_229480 [Jaminaea rosea]PWN30456.1 hypothetical protein BDZ90DRAFT_229480 [Jaminaea rosea]